MAWPRCPHCGERDILLGRRANGSAPDGSPAVFRSYPCPGCGKIIWTEEKAFCRDAPTIHLGRRFGADDEQIAQPSRQTPASGDPGQGGGTSGPRNAPEALPVEMRGIRRTA
jgi:predicted RNA-binding Zn-ribbon protein involved in translation (DUF1610 family)